VRYAQPVQVGQAVQNHPQGPGRLRFIVAAVLDDPFVKFAAQRQLHHHEDAAGRAEDVQQADDVRVT